MINDKYLPGVVTLAVSILVLFKNTKLQIDEYMIGDLPEKDFDLICMCDEHVSPEARKIIMQYYDRIVEIGDKAVPPEFNKINLSNNKNSEGIKVTYSRLINKFKILDLVEYDKILYTDADSVFFTAEFLDLFKLKTPAVNIFSEVSAYGVRINKTLYGESCTRKERAKNGDFTEATLLVLSPCEGEFEKLEKFFFENPKECYIDTFCLNKYYGVVYIIDKKFVSRYSEEDTIILDSHGSDYKPWFTEAEYYIDTWYIWAAIYNIYYRCFFKKFNNKILDESFAKTFNVQRYEWPEDYKVINAYFTKKKY